jgi:peptide/nickel transport system ATP-binding protein
MALRMALTEQTQRLKRRRVMSETVIATTPHLGKDELARIDDLSVSFMTDAGSIKAIDGVDFTIPKGKVVGVVGESGSGKSVTARSIIKLLPVTAATSGAVYLARRDGTGELDALALSGEQLRRMRGDEAAMVFQEPGSVLNPVFTIGWQIEEGLRAHGLKDKKELRAKAVDILKKVGIPDAETRVDYYPHQFSGGQKQRIVIAMALVLNPGLILADEPTTALDVTVQAEILDLLRLARDEFGASVLIITHNMGVVADIADQVVVMYRGHVVEQGDVEQIFYHPQAEYTQRLLAAVPRIGQQLTVHDDEGKALERSSDWRQEPVAVEAKGLTITYPGRLMQPDFVAVDGVDFTIHRSEVLGLVGESGSGKSTTGRAIAGLQKVSGGSLNVLGVEMNGVKERDFKPKRADIGFVFQDPGSSFDPLMTIAENVAEPLLVHHKYSSVADAKDYVGDLLEMVQLPRAYMNRFPHELSGGQRQRASLARALALKPSLLIADEPTSALDVSVQAKVLELFKKLQIEIGFACLFITHDLAVVDMLADRIMVMHQGRIVEHGDADQVIELPENPYTRKLLASLPVPDPREQRAHREHLHALAAEAV